MSDIRITGRMVNFSRLTFTTNDFDRIRQQLSVLLADDDYTGTLIIIDSTVEQELIDLIQLLIELKLQPMAVVDGPLGQQARAIQFPVMAPDQPVQRIQATSVVVPPVIAATAVAPTIAPVDEIATTTAPVTEHAQSSVAIIKAIPMNKAYHNEILRTGQSLIEENGDIVLTASMNSGSEIIASGNIYVYGSARGRVIAGASGETTARIFCSSLEAELISIAGTYCVADDIPKQYAKQSVQIYLNQHQELEFEPLSI